MNLIITPAYKAFDKALEMCEAIDKYSTMDFYHVLAVDNCGDIPDLPHGRNRAVITFRCDFIDGEHKSREGQALDLAYQFGTQKYTPYGPNPTIDNIFLIEEDVMVHENWDKKMIETSYKLRDWATLDVQSVDAGTGKVGYPTTISPTIDRVIFDGEEFDHQHYPDFQCTYFNPILWKTGIRFSDFPDHFDVLFGRKTTELTGLQHYRSRQLQVTHYPSSSRSQLPDMIGKIV